MATPIPPQREARERMEEQAFIVAADWAAISLTSLGAVYTGLKDGSIKHIKQGPRYLIPTSWARAQAGLSD